MSLSPEEQEKVLLQELLPSERKLLTLYRRTNQTLPINRIAEKLRIHPIHVSRLNSSLYNKIFDILEVRGSDKELEVLYSAGLYKQLFSEISTRVGLIVQVSDTHRRIKYFHTYLSYIIRVPYSKEVEEFFSFVVKKMNVMVPDLPTGHKEALELVGLWIRLGLKPVYTQKNRKTLSAIQKEANERLKYFDSQEDLKKNPFFLERLYSAYSVYYNNVLNDLPKVDEAIAHAYKANLLMDSYPYQFEINSTLGVMKRRVSYLFHLGRFDELIALYYSWNESEKRTYLVNVVPLSFSNVITSFITVNRYSEAKVLLSWFEDEVDKLETPSFQQSITLLFNRASLQINNEEYRGALESISYLHSVNAHPHYNLGVEAIARIWECECYILLKDWKTADAIVRRTLRWYQRNSDSYMREDMHTLRGFLSGIHYYQTKSIRSKKRWEDMMGKLRESNILYGGADLTINKISSLLGFPKELDLRTHVSEKRAS